MGYILTKHLVCLENKNSDWVRFSESLINTPYFWGGRTSRGIDCSALVQLSLQTFGVNFPRDSFLQEQMEYEEVKSIDFLRRGDIIFWKGMLV